MAAEIRPIRWQDDCLQLLDQRYLPHRVEFLECRRLDDVIAAIKDMVVRGAPAIGVAGAYAVVLGAREQFALVGNAWRRALIEPLERLEAARPTAVNLAWAVRRMQQEFGDIDGDPFTPLLASAAAMLAEDIETNRRMGEYGAAYIGAAANVITHCNAGALATAGYGTALGVIRSAHAKGRIAQVFATETRPWLQGARLTAWELNHDAIPVKLIVDGAVAYLMKTESIDWVITGADRVAANGDVANKIGTYTLAVVARAHGVKFMVVAPASTIDFELATGTEIPIEYRDPEELLSYQGQPVAAAGVDAVNPVFDVTPAALIDVLVTDAGALERPDRAGLERIFKAQKKP